MKKRIIFLGCIICACLLLVVIIRKKTENENKAVFELYLYGNMDGMTGKSDVRPITASFKQGNKKVECYASIKLQGSSSLAYDKKNYTIKFYSDSEHEISKGIDVGWGKENEYCLKANWVDKTHSRNIVTAKLAAEVQNKYDVLKSTPCNGLIDGFPVEVYINDEFHGLYTWNIPKSAWQFGMDEENPNHIVMCGETWEEAARFYALPDSYSWNVEAGPKDDETFSKFSRLFEFVMNSSDEEFKNMFNEYLDLDAVLNYYILVDFAYLPDNCAKNMLLVTYDGEIWYPSLYDLDTSWGVHYSAEELYDYDQQLVTFGETSNLARRVESVFANELHERYFELREEILTKEHVLDLFYDFEDQISKESREKEIDKWGTKIPGYDLFQIEDYLDSILEQLDKKYTNMKAD